VQPIAQDLLRITQFSHFAAAHLINLPTLASEPPDFPRQPGFQDVSGFSDAKKNTNIIC